MVTAVNKHKHVLIADLPNDVAMPTSACVVLPAHLFERVNGDVPAVVLVKVGEGRKQAMLVNVHY